MDMQKNFSLLMIIDKLSENIENVIMSLGLLSISLIVFANVIARYFFDVSFAWSEELSRYIIVWVTFLGVSSCARHNGHVNVDLVPSLLKGKAKRVQQILVNLICVVLSIYMTIISAKYTIMQFHGGNTSISISIPIWLIYLSTCIGFTFASYVYIRRFNIILRDVSKISEE